MPNIHNSNPFTFAPSRLAHLDAPQSLEAVVTKPAEEKKTAETPEANVAETKKAEQSWWNSMKEGLSKTFDAVLDSMKSKPAPLPTPFVNIKDQFNKASDKQQALNEIALALKAEAQAEGKAHNNTFVAFSEKYGINNPLANTPNQMVASALLKITGEDPVRSPMADAALQFKPAEKQPEPSTKPNMIAKTEIKKQPAIPSVPKAAPSISLPKKTTETPPSVAKAKPETTLGEKAVAAAIELKPKELAREAFAQAMPKGPELDLSQLGGGTSGELKKALEGASVGIDVEPKNVNVPTPVAEIQPTEK